MQRAGAILCTNGVDYRVTLAGHLLNILWVRFQEVRENNKQWDENIHLVLFLPDAVQAHLVDCYVLHGDVVRI